ncbi:MAG: UDP-2,4-diacetamido-2,4,6-trideoxy-beta-L-altropyranose hydrolase [Saprospiraceae bacterium]|nr:UDP-2,4-diacetamido-2,4,6-trideoxy-beta-L-altropyranose hydrolase [Saprospiraceae bacterium]
MKTKVLLRADGHNQMGLGHVVRSLALAKMLEHDFDCQFIVREPSTSLRQLIENEGFALIQLNDQVLPAHEAQYIAHHFLRGDEIVVLDGYHFDGAYQKVIKNAAGKLVCIDDIHETHFWSDSIINHTSGISVEDYEKEDYTSLKLGFEYLLLRQPFLDAAKQRGVRKKKESEQTAFICMGGADPSNTTIKALSLCAHRGDITECHVVIGGAYLHHNELNDFCKKSRLKINIYSNLNADNMVVLMSNCDLAICPPSTVALEYLCTGHHLYLIQTADNQAYLYKYLTENQLAQNWNDFKAGVRKTVKTTAINRLFDGKSDRRLLKHFRKLDYDMHCSFRKATGRDMLLYFKWANDPMTRLQSFHPEPIKIEDHRAWFNRRMADPKVVMYIMLYRGRAVGQIRFGINGVALLSYSIDPGERGKSFGTYMVQEAIKELEKDLERSINVVGYVKKDNLASNKALSNLGFKPIASDRDSSIKYLLKAS